MSLSLKSPFFFPLVLVGGGRGEDGGGRGEGVVWSRTWERIGRDGGCVVDC